jgi:hypothetical protein
VAFGLSAGRAAFPDGQKTKQPPGPPITLGNMRELGVKRLIAACLNECRHTALIDVSSYPAATEEQPVVVCNAGCELYREIYSCLLSMEHNAG